MPEEKQGLIPATRTKVAYILVDIALALSLIFELAARLASDEAMPRAAGRARLADDSVTVAFLSHLHSLSATVAAATTAHKPRVAAKVEAAAQPRRQTRYPSGRQRTPEHVRLRLQQRLPPHVPFRSTQMIAGKPAG